MPATKPLMYGIVNCDTIKKARAWLSEHAIDYDFHDYKKMGTDDQLLKSWLNELGWEQLINKRGTSWRKLDDEQKKSMNNELALQVMRDNPSIIKRPLLVVGEEIILGFDAAKYQQLFATGL